jgi:RimJ/RimL family protein N-acetyltransferase
MRGMFGTERSLLTPRLRLVPIGPGNAADLWLVHNDDAVVPWYDGWRPTRHEADDHAQRIAESWRLHGVHKWIAYHRETGEVVGRGGLSRTPIDDDWGQLYAFLPDQPWVREAHESERPSGRTRAGSCTVRHNLRAQAVMERIGMRYASEICSRGTVEGEEEVRDDAPFAVWVLLGAEREP